MKKVRQSWRIYAISIGIVLLLTVVGVKLASICGEEPNVQSSEQESVIPSVSQELEDSSENEEEESHQETSSESSQESKESDTQDSSAEGNYEEPSKTERTCESEKTEDSVSTQKDEKPREPERKEESESHAESQVAEVLEQSKLTIENEVFKVAKIVEKPKIARRIKGSSVPESSSRPSKPWRPSESDSDVNPDPEHVWGEWKFKNDEQDERTCSHCGSNQTEAHSYVQTELGYECNQDGTHITNTTYSCIKCNHIYMVTVQKNCEYGRWQFVGNGTEARYCAECNHEETRVHQHEDVPANIEYMCKAPNGNGTHLLEASYLCGICSETVSATKNEECEYEITYQKTGVNDIHIVEKDCKKCKDHKEEEGSCEPEGDLKYIKVYAQIYEYYDCSMCEDWCMRKYHTVHHFDVWEYRDEDTHISYCGCIEGRQTGEHDFFYDRKNPSTTLSCSICGGTKEVPIHDHGYDTCDQMGLMDIIKSPAYSELVSASQISNPNPDPNEYCSRYDFKCAVCGLIYSVHYVHEFQNGKCIRGYCGHIEQGTESTEREEDETTILESEENEVLKEECEAPIENEVCEEESDNSEKDEVLEEENGTSEEEKTISEESFFKKEEDSEESV